MVAFNDSESSGAIKEFVISRTFNAPRELVFKAWTERDRLLQWFGPQGMTMTTANLDLRPGGQFHYCLTAPDGQQMWGKFVYREIDPPNKIVLVSSFSDAAGGLTRHPFAPDWPREMLSTTTFEEHNGQTTMTLRCLPLNASPAEIKIFDASRDGLNHGWNGTLQQLDDYLAKSS